MRMYQACERDEAMLNEAMNEMQSDAGVLEKKQPATKRPQSPRAMLNGKSPQARASEKIQLALGWLGLFHYSTEGLIKQVLGITGGSGFMKKLAERKLVKAVPAFSISSSKVWILSPAGLVDAGMATGRDLRYPHNPERISGNYLKHNLLVQQAIIPYLPAIPRGIQSIMPARLLSTNYWSEAIPDVIFSHAQTPDGITRTALEIELTYKKPSEIESKFETLRVIFDREPTVQVRWLFPSMAMKESYRKIWETGDPEEDFTHRISFHADDSLLHPI